MTIPYVDEMEFDCYLSVGQPVEVRWTNSGRSYCQPGTIAKLNEKTLLVALDNEVRVKGELYYRAGREIKVPRIMTTGHSPNNCVQPREEN